MATMAAKIEADLGPGTSAAVSDASGDGRHVVDLVSPSFAEAESTMQPQPTVCKAQCEEVSDEPSGRPYTSRYRGVSEIRNGRWRAQFKRAGKATYLGTFDDVAEAARAWDKMWLWCDEHDGAGGRKRDINDLNFGKDAYEGDLAYLRNVSKDDLVAALQAEGRRPSSTSRYRGVSQVRNGRWRANFSLAGKSTHLGTFDDVAEAARAWDKMWLWCDEHDGAGGRRRDINELNFGKDAYEGDLAYLRNVSKDDLVTALQAEGHEPYTSPFRGVSQARNGRWRAHIRRAGKSTYLGTFVDEAEAARAWDKMWLWCDEHDGAGGRKRDINELNFGKDAYEGDLAYLRNVSKDDLVAALQAEGHEPYTSPFRGVARLPSGRWQAVFHRRNHRAGKSTYLGTFDDEAEATRAWDKMWLWCDEHDGAGGRKRDINELNFGKDAYEGDLAYLRNVSRDDLVAALQAEGHEPYTSPFRGITLLPSGRWKAVFKGGNHRVGKATFLGAFDDEVEAAQAWDKMWLWCDEHDGAGGRKRDIKELNFGKDAYEGDLAYLRNVSKDDLVAALRAEAQRFRRRRGASGGRPVFGRAAARGSDRRGGTPGAVD